MPDDIIVDDGATPPAGLAPEPLTIGDPARAAAYTADHSAKAKSANSRFEDIMQQRADIVKSTQAELQKAIDTLKARHDGQGPGQINLPLLALSAGLLSPTRTHNFGEELSNGLKGMGAAITTQRGADDDFFGRVAELQAKSGQLGDIPLKDAAAFAKAQALQEEKNVNAIDVAGIRGTKPIVNASNGTTIFPNHFGAGQHGIMYPGKKEIVPVGADPNSPATVPGGGPPNPETDLKLLQDTIDPTIKPGTMVNDIKYDKLAQIARQDPAHAAELWDILNYNQDIKAITNQRGSKTEARDLFAEARSIDPTFIPSQFANVQKARQDWQGTGKHMDSVIQLQKVVNHMGDGLFMAAALQNGNSQALNAAKNKITEWSGGQGPTNVRAVADVLSKELAKYFAGAQGSGTGEERKDLAAMLAAAKAPEQLQGAIRAVMSMVRGQAEPLAAAKTVALGNRQKYTMEKLLDESSSKTYKAIMENDIRTPEGQAALLAHNPPGTAGAGPKTWPTPSDAAIARLKEKKDADVFDRAFGPGASKKYLE